MMPYLVGLDLGQAQDFSALCVLEQSVNLFCECGQKPPTLEVLRDRVCWRCKKAMGRKYNIRWMKRWQLDTKYPQIRRDVKTLLERPPLHNDAKLIVDYTGVGRSVVNEFQESQLTSPVIPISITAGMAETKQPDGSWNVAKKHIVGVLQILMQSGRLKMAKLPESKVLIQELRTFRVKVKLDTGNESFEAWRERDHDDMVLAVALPCWFGERLSFYEPLRSVSFHVIGGDSKFPRRKGFRVPPLIYVTPEELPNLKLDEKALLITVSDHEIPKGVMPDGVSLHDSQSDRLHDLPEHSPTVQVNGAGSDAPEPAHSLTKLLGRLDLRFNDINLADYRQTWDEPIEPWGKPAKDLAMSKEDGKKLWSFMLKKRTPAPEVYVVCASGRIGKSLVYALSDVMMLRGPDNISRAVYSPADDEADPAGHQGEIPNKTISEVVRKTRQFVVG